MKNLIVLSAGLLLLGACAQAPKPFSVVNSSAEAISGKAVVVPRAEVEALITLADNDVVVVKDLNGNVLVAQQDDLNRDGQWDELAFLTDLSANETKKVVFEAVSGDKAPTFRVRTNIRFGDKLAPHAELDNVTRLTTTDSPSSSKAFQMEGPAWENDVVAFRNYYDARNGIDIYGKRTNDMVLDKVGLPGTPTYHELADWGMDILKVGNSLGAGAIAMAIGEDIYRIGPSEKGSYRFLTEGPVRAILEFTFTNVHMGERQYNVKHQVSIVAGDHFYRSKVFVEGLQGDEAFVTGIVDLHDTPMFKGEHGKHVYVASHGAQAFNHENLGLAVLVEKDQFIDAFAAPKEGEGIVSTHLVKLKMTPGQGVQYAFLAGWELQDEGFAQKDYFESIIMKSIAKL
jgi:hypothetical protein